MLSQRAVLATENDVRYIYYLAPWRLEEWMARFNEQSQLLRPEAGDRSGAEALRDFVHRLATQKGFEDVREWYVILRAQDAARKGETLAPIFSDQWGRYYAVYRLR